MKSLIYDNTKTLSSNVLELFKYANWLYREMLEGRVKQNADKNSENEQNLILAEQEVTELDLANIMAEQTITDLDLRVLELESKGE